DHRIFLSVLIEVTLKIVRFHGAAGSEILGVKIKYDPLALELIERNQRSLLIGQAEGRRRLPDRRRLGLIGSSGDKSSQEYAREKHPTLPHYRSFQFAAMINEDPIIV